MYLIKEINITDVGLFPHLMKILIIRYTTILTGTDLILETEFRKCPLLLDLITMEIYTHDCVLGFNYLYLAKTQDNIDCILELII